MITSGLVHIAIKTNDIEAIMDFIQKLCF